jgi:2-amino-4-hydroxy-6-hydroxymethyldihydropteridine diphosphokinase
VAVVVVRAAVPAQAAEVAGHGVVVVAAAVVAGPAQIESSRARHSLVTSFARPVWQPAYIGVGSNMNDPRTQVLNAVERLRALPGGTTRVVAVSKLYGSKPFGPVAQSDFVNAVVGILTQLDAPALLEQTRAIEHALGRPEKHEHWGPRIIDLDILVFGREKRTDPTLTIPHPGIVERNWVLYPLADIAPSLDIPGVGRVAALKGNIAPEGLWPLP